MPDNWSLEAADFINKTLQRKPSNRLGLNGPNEVKSHIWFQDIDWQGMSEKKIDAPFKPEPRQPAKDIKKDIESVEQQEENDALLRRNSV